jgi:hypothetical protein
LCLEGGHGGGGRGVFAGDGGARVGGRGAAMDVE